VGGTVKREESDESAINRNGVAVGLDVAAPCLGNIVANVRGERGFAHAGATGENDQVRWLKAAHHAIEIVQTGSGAGKLTIALEGMRGHVDGCRECLREALEPSIVATGFRQFVKPPFRVLNLVARREVDWCVVRD